MPKPKVRPVPQQVGLALRPVSRAQKARAKSGGGDPTFRGFLASSREDRPDLPNEQLVAAEDVGPSPGARGSPEDLLSGLCPRVQTADLVQEPAEALTPRRRAAQPSRAEVVIPASECSQTSTRIDGRPARQRFPVLERWRNESFVYEREKDSLCPTIRGVTIERRAPPTPRASRPPTPLGPRRATPAPSRRRAALPSSRGETSPAERLAAAAIAGSTAELPCAEPMDNQSQMVVAKPLCRRLWPEDQAPPAAEAPAEDENRGLQPNPNDLRCPHCSRDALPPTSSVSKQRRPDADSLKSILRRRGQPRSTRSIDFSKDAPAAVDIKNFAYMANDLWYTGYAVECDRCEQQLEWGKEGSLVGGVGNSRFTQSQALCNSCLAERLYGEIGVWLIVALAACGKKGGSEDGERPQSKGAVAQGPIRQLLDALLRLSHATRSDQLVALLGPEVAAPEVRSVVLQKARCGVSLLLGGGQEAASPSKPEDDDSPASARSHSRLKARSRSLHPRGWKRRGIVEATCKRRRANPKKEPAPASATPL